MVGYALAGRLHGHHHHGPARVFEDCARTAGMSNETITKMKESLKPGVKDMDPKKIKEKFDPVKLTEDMKAIVKEAEPDKVSFRWI